MAAATWEATLVAYNPAAAGPATLVELCGLDWTKLSVVDELGGAGSATLEVPVDTIEAVGCARLIRLDQTPAELWLRRTVGSSTSLRFAGPVTSCRVSGRALTVVAAGLLARLDGWLRDTDYTTWSTNPSTGLVDQATIVQQLVDQWQAQPYANAGLTTGLLTATGVTRTLVIPAAAGKYIGPAVAELGANANGFDISVDPTSRAITLAFPRKGNDLTGSVILDQRSIGMPDIAWSVAPGVIGSEVFASASSTQGTTITSIRSDLTLRASAGKAYVSKSFQNVADQAALDDVAQRAANDVGAQLFTISPTVVPVAGFSYGDFGTGDLVGFDFDAGLGRQTATLRVASIATTLDSGRELLEVKFL